MLSIFSRKPVSIHTAIEILFGASPCGNTWFLWTLFVISALFILLPEVKCIEFFSAILAVLYFGQSYRDWFGEFGITKILNMAVWFCLGMCMGKHYQRISAHSNKVNLTFTFLVFVVQNILLITRQNITLDDAMYIGLLFKFVLCVLGISLIWLVSCLISNNRIIDKQLGCVSKVTKTRNYASQSKAAAK